MRNQVSICAENIIPISPRISRAKPAIVTKHRFKIIEFTNPRTESQSWRVAGTKRTGERVRENFSDYESARQKQIELEAEWLARETDSTLRSTRLTAEQLGVAEAAFRLVEKDDDLLAAVNFWKTHGNKHTPQNAPRLDDAFEQFKTWMESNASMRHLTKLATRSRVGAFINSTPNLKVSDATTDMVETFLDTLKGSQRTRINYKGGISKFFSWCIERPRRWLSVNPCHAIKIRVGDIQPPKIMSVNECAALMQAAEQFENGRFVPYLALAMFDGLRPFEARRVKWEQINFEDKEIRIEGHQTKTKRPRSFVLDETTIAWLTAYRSKEIAPKNLSKAFAKLIQKIGYGVAVDGTAKHWTKDILRHTAISHFFRKTHSYGMTAERFGNSESIIKKHYQGRVTSEETKQFYSIKPKAA